MPTKLEHALALADEGFRIFPLAPNAKVPNRGFLDFQGQATRDHAQLTEWWKTYGADCNIAIATGGRPGERQLLVVDFDTKEGQLGELSMGRMLLEDGIDSGYKVRTGSGGQHWYFWLPEGVEVSGYAKGIDGYPHTDIRSKGNLAVAHGSTFNGKEYSSISKGEIPIAPPRLVELVRSGHRASKARATNKLVAEVDTPPNIARATAALLKEEPSVWGAGGDNRIIAASNRALDFVSPAAALPLMLDWNERCEPPWDPFDVEKKLLSAAKSREEVFGSKSADAEFDAVAIEPLALAQQDDLDFVKPALFGDGEPPTRQWAVDGWVPAGKTTLVSGDGGVGKTLIAQQLLTAVATEGATWFGRRVVHGTVLGVFSEDDTNEMWRRQLDICSVMNIPLATIDKVNWWTLDEVAAGGCVLMSFTRENPEGKIGTFFKQLDKALTELKPVMVVLDPIANMFGGNELDRAQVTGFVNRTLNRLCTKHGCTMIALVHPSLSGMAEGSGRSGSTSWANAVRSRLYLTRPKNDPAGDYRELRPTKNNYGKLSEKVLLRYSRGAFVLATGEDGDPEKVAECGLLAALRILAARGEEVSPKQRAGNYAVKLAMALPETEGLTREQLERALETLKRDGLVEIKVKHRGSRHDASILRLVVEAADEFDPGLDDNLQE